MQNLNQSIWKLSLKPTVRGYGPASSVRSVRSSRPAFVGQVVAVECGLELVFSHPQDRIEERVAIGTADHGIQIPGGARGGSRSVCKQCPAPGANRVLVSEVQSPVVGRRAVQRGFHSPCPGLRP